MFRKFQQGGAVGGDREFVAWLSQVFQISPDQVPQVIQQAQQDEQSAKVIQSLAQAFQQGVSPEEASAALQQSAGQSQIFKKGGKMDAFVNKYQKGGIVKDQEPAGPLRARGTAPAYPSPFWSFPWTPGVAEYNDDDPAGNGWSPVKGGYAKNVFDGNKLTQYLVTEGVYGTPRTTRRVISKYFDPSQSDTTYYDALNSTKNSPEFIARMNSMLEGFEPHALNETEAKATQKKATKNANGGTIRKAKEGVQVDANWVTGNLNEQPRMSFRQSRLIGKQNNMNKNVFQYIDSYLKAKATINSNEGFDGVSRRDKRNAARIMASGAHPIRADLILSGPAPELAINKKANFIDGANRLKNAQGVISTGPLTEEKIEVIQPARITPSAPGDGIDWTGIPTIGESTAAKRAKNDAWMQYQYERSLWDQKNHQYRPYQSSDKYMKWMWQDFNNNAWDNNLSRVKDGYRFITPTREEMDRYVWDYNKTYGNKFAQQTLPGSAQDQEMYGVNRNANMFNYDNGNWASNMGIPEDKNARNAANAIGGYVVGTATAGAMLDAGLFEEMANGVRGGYNSVKQGINTMRNSEWYQTAQSEASGARKLANSAGQGRTMGGQTRTATGQFSTKVPAGRLAGRPGLDRAAQMAENAAGYGEIWRPGWMPYGFKNGGKL